MQLLSPNEHFKTGQGNDLKLSQCGENMQELIDGPITFLTHPVFDSLDQETRDVKGVLAISICWKVLFSNLLPAEAPKGIICVVENSFNQFFSFRVDGPQATWIGFGDAHDPKVDPCEHSADTNSCPKARAGPQNQPHTSVQFSDSFKHRLRACPSADT